MYESKNTIAVIIRKKWSTAKKPVQFVTIQGKKNVKEVGNIFGEMMLQTSYRFVIRALKTVYIKSGDPFVFDLYCASIHDANSYFAMGMRNEIKTEMKEHTRRKDAVTGRMIEVMPYTTQKVVYDSGKEIGRVQGEQISAIYEVNTEVTVDSLVSACYTRILELYQCGQITGYSDVKLQKSTIYSAINEELYINRSKKIDYEAMEHMTLCVNGYDFDGSYTETLVKSDTLDKISVQTIAETLKRLVRDEFPRVDAEKCVDAIMLNGYGFDTRTIAEKLRIGQTQVMRYIGYIHKLSAMPQTFDTMHDLWTKLG